MSDLDTGAAPAAADRTVAPEEVVQTPNPVKTDPMPAETAEEEKPKLSARDAIKSAREKIEAKAKEEQPVEKPKPTKTDSSKPDDVKAAEPAKQDNPPAKPAKPAEETGKTENEPANEPAKPAKADADTGDKPTRTPIHEPPKRFSPDAQRDWKTVPDSVRGEIHRAISENEQGLNKYKASHERYETFKEYDETAKANGRDLKDSIAKVLEFEKAMTKNPLAAMNYALREAGPRKPDGSPITIDDIVASVAGKSVDERVSAVHQENQQLRAELAQIKQEAQAREAEMRIPQEVQKFAAENDRFEELADTIAVLLETGTTKDLKAAYALAETFRPATGAHTAAHDGTHTPAQTGAHTADDDTEAQTLKAQEEAAAKAASSVKGAPGRGSSTARKSQQTTIRDSLRNAFANAG
jgi:hypothetical protein